MAGSNYPTQGSKQTSELDLTGETRGDGHQWLMSVILATWEAEVGRTEVPDPFAPTSMEKNWLW
jgi:hypothetical protein